MHSILLTDPLLSSYYQCSFSLSAQHHIFTQCALLLYFSYMMVSFHHWLTSYINRDRGISHLKLQFTCFISTSPHPLQPHSLPYFYRISYVLYCTLGPVFLQSYCIINCPHWGYSMFKTVEVWMRTHVKWPATLQHWQIVFFDKNQWPARNACYKTWYSTT